MQSRAGLAREYAHLHYEFQFVMDTMVNPEQEQEIDDCSDENHANKNQRFITGTSIRISPISRAKSHDRHEDI